MQGLLVVALWAVAASCRSVSPAADWTSTCQRQRFPGGAYWHGGDHWEGGVCRPGSDVARFGQKLSANAQVYLPWTEGFANATKRWSVFETPRPNIVVVPGTEQDVVETVKFANKWDIPFLAVNGNHGTITSLGKMQHGIEIWLRPLDSFKIADDGKTVTVGGGSLSGNVVAKLWAAKKQTVTGGCECTGFTGVALGGGHGYLQGRNGLMIDQFVKMNVVLADGTLKTVDSSSDLWWGLQGAGHNFGIVTSITSKIYDVVRPTWTYRNFLYTGDKIEKLFQTLNTNFHSNGTQLPVDVIYFSVLLNIPQIDPKNPVMEFYIAQEGVNAIDKKYLDVLDSVGPVQPGGEGKTGVYTDLPKWVGEDFNSQTCAKDNMVKVRFPIDLVQYPVSAMKASYDLFAQVTRDTPALNGSTILFEGFSMQSVKAVARDSTAFPNRDDNVLIAPLITYASGGPELDQKAKDFGVKLRETYHQGSGNSEMHLYVSYAFGNEPNEQVYGYEQWRKDKLLQLKNKYDPHRKFSFYAPIA